MSTPIVITIGDHRRCAAQEGQPGGADQPRGADRIHPRGLRGGLGAGPHPRAQQGRELILGPGAVRARAGGRGEALPRHDHPVLDRWPRAQAGGARRAACVHNPDMASLATGSCQFPDRGLREPARFRRGAGAHDDASMRIKPEIEVFDVAMLYNAVNLAKRGTHQGAAARAVRDGRGERHAGSAQAARVPRRAS